MATRLPVLVVDDDTPTRQMVAEALRAEGYAVLEAGDGTEALRLVRTTAVGVVLLDIQMPRTDGPAFVKAYVTLPGPHAPVVVMTAADRAERWARVLGADGVLPKPFGLAELHRVVAAAADPLALVDRLGWHLGGARAGVDALVAALTAEGADAGHGAEVLGQLRSAEGLLAQLRSLLVADRDG
jgi:two-component system chemotaxis response regulator CheY